jgi:hypothetical protein
MFPKTPKFPRFLSGFADLLFFAVDIGQSFLRISARRPTLIEEERSTRR